MNSGFWRVASWHGVPIRLHWTLPLGMLLLGGFKIRPLFWLAFFVLVLVHELGHAFWVKRFGHKVHQLDITGFGGSCTWSGDASPVERSLIAWGGVMAQALLLAVAVILTVIFGLGFLRTSLGYAWTTTNIFLIILNLIPIRPFDGAEAWKIFSALKRHGWPSAAKTPKKRRARRVRGPGERDQGRADADAPAGVAKAAAKAEKAAKAAQLKAERAAEREAKRESKRAAKRESKRAAAKGGNGGNGGNGGKAGDSGAGRSGASSGKKTKGGTNRTTDAERIELADTFRRIAEEAGRAKDDK
jgi:hypothetical protein